MPAPGRGFEYRRGDAPPYGDQHSYAFHGQNAGSVGGGYADDFGGGGYGGGYSGSTGGGHGGGCSVVPISYTPKFGGGGKGGMPTSGFAGGQGW